MKHLHVLFALLVVTSMMPIAAASGATEKVFASLSKHGLKALGSLLGSALVGVIAL